MTTVELSSNQKDNLDAASSDEDFGPPLPERKTVVKKRRLLVNERLYLDNLPTADLYEKSFMHKDTVTHVAVSPEHNFVMTGSIDGFVKFWVKEGDELHFVKTFRAHIGNLLCMSLSNNEALLGTTGSDNAFKLFEVQNFDMTNMIALTFSPFVCEFVHSRSSPAPLIAISSNDAPCIHILHAMSGPEIVGTVEYHRALVTIIKYNAALDIAVSADKEGGLEMWQSHTLKMPTKAITRGVSFSLKSETDLFELLKIKAYALAMAVSPNGEYLAMLCSDAHLRILRFSTGKICRVYDEGIDMYSIAQNDPQLRQLHLERLDFGRRLAVEKELRKSSFVSLQTLCFDESSNFLLYASLIGIKMVNIVNNKLCRIVGKSESNQRFLAVALCQGKLRKKSRSTASMATTKGKDTASLSINPMIVCTSFKKRRFYCFTHNEPSDAAFETRDVLNEKPTVEEQAAMAGVSIAQPRLGKEAVLHTTMGDITIKLFSMEAPRAVENFSVHSRNGYYNSCTFHRVIKGFMVQTGDPKGDMTGGESIWGGEFEDEIRRELKHDRPFTVSMANCGPNTNGSQFFITTVPCPWLDGKHTIFGRVIRGMDTVVSIENVRTNSDDKPFEDIRILTIKITS